MVLCSSCSETPHCAAFATTCSRSMHRYPSRRDTASASILPPLKEPSEIVMTAMVASFPGMPGDSQPAYHVRNIKAVIPLTQVRAEETTHPGKRSSDGAPNFFYTPLSNE